MFVDTRDRGFAPHILMDGYWEYWITRFLVGAVTPGMVAIDVGANFGYYSLLFADLTGPGGRVIAVEPNPVAADALAGTLSVNGFGATTRVVPRALSAGGEGSVLFYVPDGEPKNARIVTVAVNENGRTIEVPCTSIDALTRDLARVDIIKVDAEGAEADIVHGMRETLRRHRPALLLEINAGRNYDVAALLSELQGVYGALSFIDDDSVARPLTVRDVLTTRVGEDWMVYAR